MKIISYKIDLILIRILSNLLLTTLYSILNLIITSKLFICLLGKIFRKLKVFILKNKYSLHGVASDQALISRKKEYTFK